MAKLILSLDGQVIKEYDINKERMTVGRKPHNDIQIDNLAVSGEHAMIMTILNDSFLEDLGSTNGTMVNGQPIKKHFLQADDVVEIGKYTLRYVDDKAGATSQQEFEKTMVLRAPAAAAAGATSKPSAPASQTTAAVTKPAGAQTNLQATTTAGIAKPVAETAARSDTALSKSAAVQTNPQATTAAGIAKQAGKTDTQGDAGAPKPAAVHTNPQVTTTVDIAKQAAETVAQSNAPLAKSAVAQTNPQAAAAAQAAVKAATSSQQMERVENPGQGHSTPLEPSSANISGVIQILSGPNAGRELPLSKPLTTLGKPGIQVAVIAKRPQGYFITHVEGANFPMVNGKPLDAQAQKLQEHDVIELAGVKMEFFLAH